MRGPHKATSDGDEPVKGAQRVLASSGGAPLYTVYVPPHGALPLHPSEIVRLVHPGLVTVKALPTQAPAAGTLKLYASVNVGPLT